VSDLRERLIAAKIAGRQIPHGYQFRTNESAAEQAVVEFGAFLRDEATAKAMSEETTEHHWYRDSDDSCSCGQWRDGDGSIHADHVARVGLAFLADAIDPQPERTAPA